MGDQQRKRAFIATGLGWGLDGFDYTMFALALPALLISLNLTVAEGGVVTTASIVASAFGGIAGGYLADRFGRARVLQYIILSFSLLTALTATAQNFEQLVFWRVLQGFAFGAEWPVGAALLAEYANAKNRGRTMGFLQSFYSIGWFFSTLTYFAIFSLFPEGVAWRYLFLVGILPALSIFWIRRNVKDKVVLNPVDKPKNTLKEIFKGKILKTTIITTLFTLGCHGTYYSIVSFLPLYLKSERGMDLIGTTTYIWILIFGTLIGYWSGGFFHDKLGRRLTYTLYTLGCGLSVAFFIFSPIEGNVAYIIAWFLGFFAAGQGAGHGSFLSELFPTALRATGKGFAYNFGRGIAAFGPAFIGFYANTIGLGNAILIIAASACTLVVLMVWLLPETKGKDILADIEATQKNDSPQSTNAEGLNITH